MNIFITGVGGQGVNKLGDIIADVLFKQGCDVKLSSIKGVSQRNGGVVVELRYGSKIYSPHISLGEADFLIALDKLEGIRHINYLKKGGVAIIYDKVVTNSSINSLHHNLGFESSQQEFDDNFKLKIIKQTGFDEKYINIFMLRELSKLVDIRKEEWGGSIRKIIPREYVRENLRIFNNI